MARRVLLATAALAVLACAYTWPVVLHPNSRVVHDLDDPLLVTWLVWWSTHTVPLTSAWWNAPAFYPSAGVFGFSETMLGLAPIAWPVLAITNAPLVAYNVAYLLSFVLSGLGAYFLAFVLTRRHAAAFVAALAFAFAPYRLSHTHHLQLLSSYWMPIALASLHLYLGNGRRRWAWLFAASWLLQALTCGYYLFYLTLLVALWLAWFGTVDAWRRFGGRLAIAWGTAAAVLAPVLIGYRSILAQYGFTRTPGEIFYYSADVAGLWSASPDSLLWRWLHGSRVLSESEQFPGLTSLILFAAAAAGARGAWRARSTLGFYVFVAPLMWFCSLGSRPKLWGRTIGIPGPYRILAALPGFDGMRVPARLWMVSVLCVAIAAAFAIARVQPDRKRRWLAAIAVAGLLADGWPHALAVPRVPPMRVSSVAARARLVLPVREFAGESQAMYGSIAQGRAVFNGYSGYEAPQHAALVDLVRRRDPRILARLAATEPIEVIVEASGDPDGSLTAYVAGQPGATRVDANAEWSSYLLPATGALAPPPVRGEPLGIASISASVNAKDIAAVLDGNLESAWRAPRQTGTETLTIDLRTPLRVGAVQMSLGTHADEYPRDVSIDVSADGIAWAAIPAVSAALETYDAAIRSPRAVPVMFSIDRESVRLIRVRQIGADTHGWSIAELRVLK